MIQRIIFILLLLSSYILLITGVIYDMKWCIITGMVLIVVIGLISICANLISNTPSKTSKTPRIIPL